MQHPASSRSRAGRGWRVRRSIPHELEVAIEFVREGPAALPSRLVELVMAVPPSWVEELDALGTAMSPKGEPRYTFEYLARWAQAAEIDDYDAASTAMREVTVDNAIRQVVEASGLEPTRDLDPTEQLIDLELRLYAALVLQTGLYPASDTEVLERERGEILSAVNVLRGEPLHGRFWRWMDRFYDEAYRPWRTARLDFVAELEQTAVDGLGAREGVGPPNLDWLPPDNILTSVPTVGGAVAAGEFEVVFWTEPFGLSSAIVQAPGALAVSFAEHGIDVDYSLALRDELVSQLKALSDPTRLSIVRMIRNLDADNTQIAGYLGVSRPAVSVHAKILADAGFISTSREGRQARHAFHPDKVRHLCTELLRYLEVPAERLDGSGAPLS